MKKTLFISATLIIGLFTLGQNEIEKLKSKHLIGSWFSKNVFTNVKNEPILTFYKAPPQNIKDSIMTTFHLSKNEINLIRKSDSKIDTIYATWFFSKDSRNLEIVERIKTGQKILTSKTTNYGKTYAEEDVYISKMITFHIESFTDEKFVLKYIK
jgi:hypothetical protein